MDRLHSDRGQASVELVAILPLCGAVVALLWQSVLAGAALWFSGGAAAAAARAEAVGGDPLHAARHVVPGRYRDGLRIRRISGGAIAVAVPIPTVVGGRSLGSVTAEAHFSEQQR